MQILQPPHRCNHHHHYHIHRIVGVVVGSERKELWKALIFTTLIYCDSLLTFPAWNKLLFIGRVRAVLAPHSVTTGLLTGAFRFFFCWSGECTEKSLRLNEHRIYGITDPDPSNVCRFRLREYLVNDVWKSIRIQSGFWQNHTALSDHGIGVPKF